MSGAVPPPVEVIHDPSRFASAMDEHRAAGRRVGLVPTMGALHGGHLSLIEEAARRSDVVAVSVFVNPLQFGPREDLAAYPRRLDTDLALAAGAGADVVFAPATSAMYPEPFLTTVHVAGPSEPLEGAARPGHFDGVATVVTKLFNLTGRCAACFGEKDFQQLVVVRRLVADLDLPVEIVACPTVREPDGLACSSRNAYLDLAQRAAAPVLHRALLAGKALVEAGVADPDEVIAAVAGVVAGEPLADLDYAAVVEESTMQKPVKLDGEVRILVAARFGSTRLIDNLGARRA